VEDLPRRDGSGASRLGLWSGVGLVVANMIGSGVFLSTGFMAQSMNPGTILLAWCVGALIAMAGTRAYAVVAQAIPRSGGEYRYLSDLLHPFVGYLAGWTSLLVGFSAPIAAAALAAGHFAGTLGSTADPRFVALVLIVLLTLLHAVGFELSRGTQNVLVAVKAGLLLAFTTVGLSHAISWPAWTAPQVPAEGGLAFFMTSLFFVAFAFSGWNAAVYAAGEFASPERNIPRAMLVGCGLVAVLYLLVNWVFVASLTPERAAVVLEYESQRVTLGHLVMRDILGDAGGKAMSILTIVAVVSSMSAMIFLGPRVYTAMARDGFLPRALSSDDGRPPRASILLQGVLALVLLWTHTLQQILQNAGAILTLFAALTALTVLLGRPLAPAGLGGRAAAAVYVASAAVMLCFGLRSLRLWLWVAVATLCAGVFYVLARRQKHAEEP
jgi:APA family basic amino acid/polyamine antiporter